MRFFFRGIEASNDQTASSERQQKRIERRSEAEKKVRLEEGYIERDGMLLYLLHPSKAADASLFRCTLWRIRNRKESIYITIGRLFVVNTSLLFT